MSVLAKEVRATQNPALGAAILWRFTCGYRESHAENAFAKLPMAFVALPLVLHEPTREVIESTQKSSGLRAFVGKFSETKSARQDILLSLHDWANACKKLTWERVEHLRREVNAADTEARTKRALKMVNALAGKLLPRLDVERPDDPMELVIDDLTIRVNGRNRDDYLWEIGSGSNWLSYHLATILGLQQFFMGLTHSPVPNLTIIDQPSQVYFPKQLTPRPGEDIIDPKFRDEDVEAVRKAFAVMGDAVSQAKGKLQIIVFDHAPESVWEKLPNVELVEEWRNGVKLVPTDWLN